MAICKRSWSVTLLGVCVSISCLASRYLSSYLIFSNDSQVFLHINIVKYWYLISISWYITAISHSAINEYKGSISYSQLFPLPLQQGKKENVRHLRNVVTWDLLAELDHQCDFRNHLRDKLLPHRVGVDYQFTKVRLKNWMRESEQSRQYLLTTEQGISHMSS